MDIYIYVYLIYIYTYIYLYIYIYMANVFLNLELTSIDLGFNLIYFVLFLERYK